MIWESWPWKRELLKRAASLDSRKRQRRWSDASCARVEQDIFLSAYVIRKLLDAKKISDEVESLCLRALTHQPLSRPVDIMNWDKIDRLYDLSHCAKASVSLREFCNQIVHSFVFLPCFDGDSGGLSGIFVSSDREKERRLLHFNLCEIVSVFRRVAEDDLVALHMTRDAVGEPLKVRGKSCRQFERMSGGLLDKEAE